MFFVCICRFNSSLLYDFHCFSVLKRVPERSRALWATFIEFEAVVTTEAERAAADGQLTFLSEHFQINANDLLTMSYGDMIEAAMNAKAAVIRDPLGDLGSGANPIQIQSMSLHVRIEATKSMSRR